MQGRMEVDQFTIVRSTARANSPMGKFQATYSGTSQEVPGLSSDNCGETLLGIPREVFTRSLFVRQAGLSIDQSGELEKRIASLITTGEETTSYAETMAALRKQLNRRRHNKTGLLPAIEAKIMALQAQLAEIETLTTQLHSCTEQMQKLRLKCDFLQEQLQLHHSFDAMQQWKKLKDLQAQVQQLRSQEAALKQITASYPSAQQLEQYRLQLTLLEEDAAAQEQAQQSLQNAAAEHTACQQKVSTSFFQGLSPEQAAQKLQVQQSALLGSTRFLLPTFFSGILLTFFSAAVYFFLHQPMIALPLFILTLFAFAGSGYILYRSHSQKSAADSALKQQYGSSDPSALKQMLKEYQEQWALLQAAAEKERQAQYLLSVRQDALTQRCSIISKPLQEFDLDPAQPAAASAALAHMCNMLQQLEQCKQKLQHTEVQYQLQSQQCPSPPPLFPEVPSQPPAESVQQLTQQLQQAKESLQELQRQQNFLTGRISALGEQDALQSELLLNQQEQQRLLIEYDAIATAMQVLETVNIQLQNRFSPALGQEAARILSAMTGGRYNKVYLDRDFAISAQTENDPLLREAAFLSQGTMDQLYLAVRFAICHMVLPKEKQLPLILDDAFANFDDVRLSSVLDWLCQEAQQRQILLFTCHSREYNYLQKRADFHYIKLES